MNNTFKVVIVGESGVGKSTFVERTLGHKFRQMYTATTDVDVCPLRFATSRGIITINMWDVAGSQNPGNIRDSYYASSNAAIVVSDSYEYPGLDKVYKWSTDIERVAAGIPLFYIRSKQDLHPSSTNIQGVYDVNNKTMDGYKEFYTNLLKYLTGDNSIIVYTYP